MTKLDIEIKPLFKISIGGRKELASQKTIDFYKKWWKNRELKIIEDIGVIDLGKLDLFITKSHKARCYVEVDYELISENPLDDFSLEVLRASGNFKRGAGQENGKLYGKKEENGKFIYKLKSICDSSD